MPEKAYSYLRFSTPEQMRGDSFRRQIQLTKEYAAEKGLDLDDSLTFRDLGVSAFRGRNADTGALGSFLKAVEAGNIPSGAHLLVESLDRISRDQIVEAQTLFLQILLAGITLHTLQDRKVYSRASVNASPMDIIASIVILIRAHEESAVKAKRLRAAWENKRANLSNGKPLTARTPAWIKLVGDRFRLIADKAKIVQRVYSLALKGHSPNGIALQFNREKVPLVGRGKRWHRSYITALLDNPAVIGTLTPQRLQYDGRKRKRVKLEPIEGYFPAAIDRATWDRVRAMRQTAPLRGRNAGREIKNLIGGLARCPLCHGPMNRIHKGAKDQPRFVCARAKAGAGCVYHSVPYADVEEAIIERRKQIARTMPGANERAQEIETQLASVESDLLAIEDRIETLTDQISLKPSRALSRKLEELERQHDALSATKVDLRKSRDLADGAFLKARLRELVTALGATPLDRQKANARLRQLLASVTVDYRTGELDLAWQHGGGSSIQYAWPEPNAGRGSKKKRTANLGGGKAKVSRALSANPASV